MPHADFQARYGPWALVTGAAQGIGAAYTERLARLGLSVVLVDRQAELLQEQATRVRSLRPGVQTREIVADLIDQTQVHRVVDDVADLEIGLLVANAANGKVGRWLEQPLEVKLNEIAVNCAAVMIMADRLTRLMAQRRRGGVIIMSSGSAAMGCSMIASYAATKAYDRVLAESLWVELAPYGIDVTTVMPGATATPGFAASLPAGVAPTKMMQPGSPSDVVDAAIEGLGTRINVFPGGRRSSVILGLLTKFVPRKTMIRLGDRAVRAQYDH
jgi:short-subunit dehydrogenase